MDVWFYVYLFKDDPEMPRDLLNNMLREVIEMGIEKEACPPACKDIMHIRSSLLSLNNQENTPKRGFS